jgi:hypothetical protein
MLAARLSEKEVLKNIFTDINSILQQLSFKFGFR